MRRPLISGGLYSQPGCLSFPLKLVDPYLSFRGNFREAPTGPPAAPTRTEATLSDRWRRRLITYLASVGEAVTVRNGKLFMVTTAMVVQVQHWQPTIKSGFCESRQVHKSLYRIEWNGEKKV